MAIKWGFGKKAEAKESHETPEPAAPAAEPAAAEPKPEETRPEAERPAAALERKGILLLGRGYPAQLWEKRFAAANLEFATDQALKPEDFARLEFETIIETEGLRSRRGYWTFEGDEPGQFPALAPGGVALLPCYGASPTMMASLLGKMAPRVAGYTLFAPPEGAAKQVIEIARPMQAADEAWKEAITRARLWDFKPEVVGDSPGLVFGRAIACLVNEAAHALTEQIATAQGIDDAMRLGVNYPKGLFAWADELGLDLVLEILEGLVEHYEEDRYRPAPLLRHMLLAKKRFFEPPAAQ